MFNKIGFFNNEYETIQNEETINATETAPKQSLVSVYFSSRGRAYTYYNDKFDLKKGDTVFVEGKLEGVRGVVQDVNYNFKIKLSDYKKVIAVADCSISGKFYFAGSHMLSFDRSSIPFEKVVNWYIAPNKLDDEIIICTGDDKVDFNINDELNDIKADYEIKNRGVDYFFSNNVVYISIDRGVGKAIVLGSEAYEISFTYQNGDIKNITCDCFCNYTCKHEIAMFLQLKETIKIIEEKYNDIYEQQDYFAAISTSELMSKINFNNKGYITVN